MEFKAEEDVSDFLRMLTKAETEVPLVSSPQLGLTALLIIVQASIISSQCFMLCTLCAQPAIAIMPMHSQDSV